LDPSMMRLESKRLSREFRGRILNVLPAASLQMGRFLSLVDLILSTSTPSAAVEVGPQPRLHLNPEFVQTFCRRDEHLFLLVMHELYHIILGHCSLFPKVSLQENIAFDAVINAMLCRSFREPVYLDFFRAVNPGDSFPGRLLKPPAGWPDRFELAGEAGPAEARVMRLLYGKSGEEVTYGEILDLLRQESGARAMDPCVLIGEHGESGGGSPRPEGLQDLGPDPARQHSGDEIRDAAREECSGEEANSRMVEGKPVLRDEDAVRDELFRNILRRVACGWPQRMRSGMGRSLEQAVEGFLLQAGKSPRAEFLVALRRLLERCGVLQNPGNRVFGWTPADRDEGFSTVLPDWRDRRAAGWEDLTGQAPLIFNSVRSRRRPAFRPKSQAHLYLDISGSMGDCLPWLAKALDPLEKKGLCRMFVFSTVVDTVAHGKLLKQRLDNTYGTDIRCVFDHVLSLPAGQTPRKVVVLTDGYTGAPSPDQYERWQKRGVELHVGVVDSWSVTDFLRPYARSLEILPALSPADTGSPL